MPKNDQTCRRALTQKSTNSFITNFQHLTQSGIIYINSMKYTEHVVNYMGKDVIKGA